MKRAELERLKAELPEPPDYVQTPAALGMWLVSIALMVAKARRYTPGELRQLLLIIYAMQGVDDTATDGELTAEFTDALSRARRGQLN